MSKKNPRTSGPGSQLNLRGEFTVEHIRDEKVLSTQTFSNGITNEGKDHLLNVTFSDVSAVADWYIGLINLVNFSALADDDAYDDIDQGGHAWDTFSLYTDTANAASAVTRPKWTESGASGESITNGSVVEFLITGAGDIKGVFLVGGTNAQTKGDHTGAGNTLWATALFASDVPVVASDVLKVTYTINA